MFHDTHQRNNIDACERAIEKAEGSQYSIVFKNDISKVRRLMEKLQSNNRWPHDIPDKNRCTLTEISHLQSPPKQAQDVMKAICFLVFNFDDEYTVRNLLVESLLWFSHFKQVFLRSWFLWMVGCTKCVYFKWYVICSSGITCQTIRYALHMFQRVSIKTKYKI